MEDITRAVLNLAQKKLKNFKTNSNGDELIAETCPFCNGGDHHDKYSFYINMETGAYQCKRGKCNAEGSFKTLCQKLDSAESYVYNHPQIRAKSEKIYQKIDANILKPLTDEIVTYFAIRGISRQTLDDFKVSADDKGNIVFPFFRNKELEYVKFRKPVKHTKDSGPKEWQLPDTKPILFGMDNISFNKPLFITEGEIDALSLYESGVHNVVSVPSGSKNLDWILLCYDWLQKFNEIVVFGDNDAPGIQMVSDIKNRLGEDRCMDVPDYPRLIIDGKDYGRNCKDANEILYAYGPQAVKEIADKCEMPPVQGLLQISNIQFNDGLNTPKIYTRIPDLDVAIGGLKEGQVTVITGKSGEGKSTLSQYLMLNAIEQGYNCAAYSGELTGEKFAEWTILQATERKYIGVKHDPNTGKKYATVDAKIVKRIQDWMQDRYFLFNNKYDSPKSQREKILEIFRICAKRYGCKLFLCDNLMSALADVDDEFKAQAMFVNAMKNFATEMNVHVIIVAHPRKTKAGDPIGQDDVAGAKAIINLADIALTVERPNIRIIKNRDDGEKKRIICSYDPSNRRIFQKNVGDRTSYGWDHTGIEEPADPAERYDEFRISHGVDRDNPF